MVRRCPACARYTRQAVKLRLDYIDGRCFIEQEWAEQREGVGLRWAKLHDNHRVLHQRTPWGWKTSRMTPLPKRGFGPPLVWYVFHPPQVSLLCFSSTKFHDRADQMLFLEGPIIFGRARYFFSCNKMSLFYLETCTPMQGTP